MSNKITHRGFFSFHFYIVEQIYSLPAEERINANYLMRLEYEKHDLKNELRIISKKQQQLQQKFSGISNWYKNNIKGKMDFIL